MGHPNNHLDHHDHHDHHDRHDRHDDGDHDDHGDICLNSQLWINHSVCQSHVGIEMLGQLKQKHEIWGFLAVQDSSIGDIVSQSVSN